MADRPVLTALLESDEGLQVLDHEVLSPGEASSLGYTGEDIGTLEEYEDYRQRRELFSPEADSIDYHRVVDEIIDEYIFLYEEGLLEEDIETRADADMRFLASNRERSLNDSEIGAVVSTAMKKDGFFPKKAVDKEELVDRLYVGLYSSLADTPDSAVSEQDGNVV